MLPGERTEPTEAGPCGAEGAFAAVWATGASDRDAGFGTVGAFGGAGAFGTGNVFASGAGPAGSGAAARGGCEGVAPGTGTDTFGSATTGAGACFGALCPALMRRASASARSRRSSADSAPSWGAARSGADGATGGRTGRRASTEAAEAGASGGGAIRAVLGAVAPGRSSMSRSEPPLRGRGSSSRDRRSSKDVPRDAFGSDMGHVSLVLAARERALPSRAILNERGEGTLKASYGRAPTYSSRTSKSGLRPRSRSSGRGRALALSSRGNVSPIQL